MAETSSHHAAANPVERSAPAPAPAVRSVPGVGALGGGVTRVAVASLRPGDSPRFIREDVDHARVLAEVEETLPPILVNQTDMTIIDGLHRYLAAKIKGETTILVRFFTGLPEDAYLAAVKTNVQHGKPLSLAEREAAARHVLSTHSYMSDRALAAVCGLSPKTIARLRLANPGTGRAGARVGLDGRVRPVDTASARRRLAELIAESPDATLRSLAREAGASASVVRDVRDRLRRGLSPVPTRMTKQEDQTTRDRLIQDCALRSVPKGTEFAGWFDSMRIERSDWERYLDMIPVSRAYELADEARTRAAAWSEFAQAVEGRVRSMSRRRH